MADGYTLPTLAELKPSSVVVCGTEEDLFWQAANVLDYIYLQDNIDELVSAFSSGKQVTRPTERYTASAELIFSSDGFPEFSYYITAYLYADGSAYLHESGTGHTVRVSADILMQYYPFKTDES